MNSNEEISKELMGEDLINTLRNLPKYSQHEIQVNKKRKDCLLLRIYSLGGIILFFIILETVLIMPKNKRFSVLYI